MIDRFSEEVGIEALISFIEGNCEKTNKQAVTNWLNSDPKNRKLFLQIKEIWLTRDDLMQLKKENIENDFKNILRKLH